MDAVDGAKVAKAEAGATLPSKKPNPFGKLLCTGGRRGGGGAAAGALQTLPAQMGRGLSQLLSPVRMLGTPPPSPAAQNGVEDRDVAAAVLQAATAAADEAHGMTGRAAEPAAAATATTLASSDAPTAEESDAAATSARRRLQMTAADDPFAIAM